MVDVHGNIVLLLCTCTHVVRLMVDLLTFATRQTAIDLVVFFQKMFFYFSTQTLCLVQLQLYYALLHPPTHTHTHTPVPVPSTTSCITTTKINFTNTTSSPRPTRTTPRFLPPLPPTPLVVRPMPALRTVPNM